MAAQNACVTRALELMGAVEDRKSVLRPLPDKAVEDCAIDVVNRVDETVNGLAKADRLDAESVHLALSVIDDMQREALGELRLAGRPLLRANLEREKWIPQRVTELEIELEKSAS